MKVSFTALIKRDGDGWVGWAEDLPGVIAQERTRDELIESLSEAYRDILERNRQEARRAVVGGFEAVRMNGMKRTA